MNQKKSFSLPPFFAAFVNMLFCHRFVNNFFGNLQKTFCEGFLKPHCFMRRGRLLRSSLMPVNSFFLFFPEIFFPEPSEKGCFQAANATVYASRTGVSIFSKNFFQEHGFPFCFSSAAWDLPVRLLPAAALFSLFLSNAEVHRSVISLTGEQYLYYVSFHCFVLPACLFPCGPASRAR
jgi:hypothetical protein